jgi:FkbH-like protein
LNPHKTQDLDYFRLLKRSKRIDSKASATLRIALLSDAASQQFVPLLKALFDENGVAAEVFEGAFDAVELEVFNPQSDLYRFAPDVVVLAHSSQALRSRFYHSSATREFAATHINDLVRIWRAIEANCTARIIQCNVAVPAERTFGSFDLKVVDSLYSAASEVNTRIAVEAREHANVLVCDVDSIASWVGRRNWFDERLWNMSKSFCALEYLPLVAQNLVDIVLSTMGRVVKCVILDLDNTLWGGVVGDDGHLGIAIGAHGDGEAFYLFQRYLLSLKNRGILLAVCSKNDLENAVRPFNDNPDMALKRDDITVFIANWENKADNIRSIRDILEIGFDSMVFLDDNAFERNLVRQFLPDVIVPELPEDPADYVKALMALNLFETSSFSREDVVRSQLYKQEADRRELQKSFTSIDDYLKSLDMVIEVSRFSPAKLSRIAQLIQRSNQFNLTTNRWSEADCERMMLDEERYIPMYASLSDNFGDHGLILVAILCPDGNDLVISDWLMSCRVLQRGVEQFIMNRVFALAESRGFSRVRGSFIPTAKNGMVKDFYSRFNFTKGGESANGKVEWLMDTADYRPSTPFISELQAALA